MKIDIFFYLLLVLISFLVCFFFFFFLSFSISPSLLLFSIALVTSSLLASKLRFSIITLSIFLIRIALRLLPTCSFFFPLSVFSLSPLFLFYLWYSTFPAFEESLHCITVTITGENKISILRRISISSYWLAKLCIHVFLINISIFLKRHYHYKWKRILSLIFHSIQFFRNAVLPLSKPSLRVCDVAAPFWKIATACITGCTNDSR